MKDRQLRVMHVIPNLGGGGVERLLVKSLAVFDRTICRHMLCSISGGGVYEGEVKNLDIPYWVMNRRARFDISVVIQIARLMQRERVDVVHTSNFTANAWGRLAAKIAGVPRIIAHERGTAWTESPAMKLVDRIFYRFTDLLLTNSQAAKTVLMDYIRLPEDRIRVIYNGLPSPREISGKTKTLRTRIEINPKTLLIGTVGRMDTPKGHCFLLNAIPRVWEQVPDAHFVLIGDGPLRGYLQELAHRLGLSNSGKFHLLGFTPNAPDLLKELDVLAHPSIRESLGNVLIEASLSGIPAVASSVDGCSEVVVNGQTGILVKCTEPVNYIDADGASPLPKVVVDGQTRQLRAPLGPNPKDLASGIVQLLQDPHLREQMGTQARARAEQLFNIQRYVRDLENAYRDI
jgi:glycosyltransferase involved in cell wall biosynthesis